LLESVINITNEIKEVQGQSKVVRLGHEKMLQDVIKIAVDSLPFKEIDRMFPVEPNGDPFVRDMYGKVLKGILIHQIPDFSKGRYVESEDSYQFDGVMREVYVMSDGCLRFFERKILNAYKGNRKSDFCFRVGLERLSLDDLDLEIMIDHLKSMRNKTIQ